MSRQLQVALDLVLLGLKFGNTALRTNGQWKFLLSKRCWLTAEITGAYSPLILFSCPRRLSKSPEIVTPFRLRGKPLFLCTVSEKLIIYYRSGTFLRFTSSSDMLTATSCDIHTRNNASTKDYLPNTGTSFVPKRFNLCVAVFISCQIHKTLFIE